MKKLMAMAMMLGLCAPASLTLDHLYPMTLKVSDVNTDTDIVTMTDSRGNDWEIEGVEDWDVDDYVSAIFFDNGTKTCLDDVIVQARYVRIDLIP